MSTIETILSRAMSEPEFANQLLAEPETALMDYDLSPEEMEQFKSISRADFEALASDSPEQRKSLSLNFTKIQFSHVSMGPNR